MAATGKAPWTMYVVALLALGVSTATSMMVQVRERRGTGQHNATLASTLTQEAEDKPLSRKGRAVAERNARREEAWKADEGIPLSSKEVATAEPDAHRTQGAKEAESTAQVTPTIDGYTLLQGACAYADGTNLNDGESIFCLYCSFSRCQQACDGDDSCVAFQVQSPNWHCFIHTSPDVAAGGGQPNDYCYKKGAAQTQASATGDPHLQNVYGERFDLMKPGNHVLINIPRGKRADTALLRLEAEAQLLGGLCTDNMYFHKVNITGSWVEATHAGGYVFESGTATSETPKWLTFGKVGVKVVHGQTRTSIRYLNVYVKSLGHTGFPVGGLLGEDDHKEVTTPPPACERRVSLEKTNAVLQKGSEASVASASF